jgi:hypothetical protein
MTRNPELPLKWGSEEDRRPMMRTSPKSRNLEQELLWELGNKEARCPSRIPKSRNPQLARKWGSEEGGREMPSQCLYLHMVDENKWGRENKRGRK